MLFVENDNQNPYQNHALEEWLMDHVSEDCFMLWRNEKAILLGRNQNLYREINLPYVTEKGIKIVRRITGGGAVFTDEGNIMFTFICRKGQAAFMDFEQFTKPLLSVLQNMGIPAEFTGRNDLTVAGRKFSGNAQCLYKGRLLHHGTLMYQANIEELAQVLNVGKLKLESKGVSSVQSRVTNLSRYLSPPPEVEEFLRTLFKQMKEITPGAKYFRLSDRQWEEVRLLALEKHAAKEWIFGSNPQFDIGKETRLSGGILEVFLKVKKGRIEAVKIYGDFFGAREIEEVEQSLRGVLYEQEAIRGCLERFIEEAYFGKITLEELVAAFL